MQTISESGEREIKQFKTTVTSRQPDFRFSSLSYGKNIILSEDGLEACRRYLDKKEENGVYIATPLKGMFDLELQITGFTSTTDTSLEIGISQCPRQLQYKSRIMHLDIPHRVIWPDSNGPHSNMCTWYGNKVYNTLSGYRNKKSYGFFDLNNSKKGDRIGLHIKENGKLFFFHNGVDQGLAADNIYSRNVDIYAVVEVCGSCTALKITRAGIFDVSLIV